MPENQNDNFKSYERPTVKIISIKKPIYIRVLEIKEFAFYSIRKIFNVPDLAKNEIKAILVNSVKNMHLSNADIDDQIIVSLNINLNNQTFILDCVFSIEVTWKINKRSAKKLNNEEYTIPFYILNLLEVTS